MSESLQERLVICGNIWCYVNLVLPMTTFEFRTVNNFSSALSLGERLRYDVENRLETINDCILFR